MTPTRVVIVGGGFAAVQFARTLRGKLSTSQCEILLFSSENHMVFHPLLADVAGASINVDAAATPLRQMLPKVGCRTERIQRIDLAASEIVFDDGSGELNHLHYDHVVIACGAESNLSIIPGMTEHAFAFKVMRDAIDVRQHVVSQMEQAEGTSDPQRRRRHLSFIIVGAGFSGVEVAGEINELVRSSTRFYHNFRKEDVVVSLVHPKDHILPEVAPTLAEFARKRMEKAGITLVLNTRAVAATHEGVELSDGRMLTGATIVCTIGTATSPLVQYLDAPKERGRILTQPDMRIQGHTNAWALGDCALIINAYDNKPSLTTGQFAERQGRQAALNLVRVLKGEPTRPFSFKALGELCSIGGYQAVAEMFGMHISGILAWFLWRSVYLFKLPTWSRRLKVALDWGWDLLFPRDLSFLNSNSATAKPFTRAYYRPGDFIQRQGDPARVFSVIEEGQAEVLVSDAPNDPQRVVAVLGKGDFFGNAALLENRPHQTSIRARTVVRLRQATSSLFSEMAGSFAPLRELLANAVNRNSDELRRRLPLAKDLLDREPLASFLDPLPARTLRNDTSLGDAIKYLGESSGGQLIVLGENNRLWGKLDRKDLYQMVARIALIPLDKHEGLSQRKLSDFLHPDPLCVTLQDSPFVVAGTMIEHDIAWLPVVRSLDDTEPVGYIREEKIMDFMLNKVASAKAKEDAATSAPAPGEQPVQRRAESA
ncbi:MAG: FAD-dependent oxidoreductase [Candidatus Acidiferrum sp.]|jgi:NADH:quinone reductase (non-electrogenic)